MTDTPDLPSKSNPKIILEATVFVSGALVMVYEIIGSRLLSPYLGASTYVWTSLIGVILGALSLGYWFGGKLADKKPDLKTLAWVIFLAGGIISATILVKDLILSLIARMPVGLEIKSIVAAFLLFAPASVLFGFVTPYAVRLKISSLADSGKTVGRLYALSTVGSILGTFLAGFFLIPFVGSEKTLYLIGATLIGLSMLLAPFALKVQNIAVLVLFAFAVSISEAKNYYQRQFNDFYDTDTEYARLQIFKMRDPKTKKIIRGLATDPFFVQSRTFLDSDELVSDYANYYHLLRHFKPDFQKTLLIGGAGYSFPRNYLQTYPNAEIEVVEIDPQMTALAKRFFRLQDNPHLKITHEDGRAYLNQAADQSCDAVLIDAFGSLLSIPFQLTTAEAAAQVSRVLKDDGVAIFNIGGATDGDASRFLRAELKTYRQVFPKVYLFKVHPEEPNDELQNYIIVAGKEKTVASFTSDDPFIAEMLEHLDTDSLDTELNVLTDDLAPVEYYNSFAQSSMRPQ